MIPPPGYQCRQNAQAALLRVVISSVASCFDSVSEVTAVADEVKTCTGLNALIDIYNREVEEALCYLLSITSNVPEGGIDAVIHTGPVATTGASIYGCFFKTITLPELESCEEDIWFAPSDQTHPGFMWLLESISCPILAHVAGTLTCYGNNRCTMIDLPLLTQVDGSIHVANNGVLQTINLPLLSILGGDFTAFGTVLTGLSLPSLTSWTGVTFDCSGCSLTSADINALLILFQSLGVAGRTINFVSGANGPATGAGLTAKAALILAGNSVSTNP